MSNNEPKIDFTLVSGKSKLKNNDEIKKDMNTIYGSYAKPVNEQKYHLEVSDISLPKINAEYHLDTSVTGHGTTKVFSGNIFGKNIFERLPMYLESKCINCDNSTIHYKSYNHFFCNHCKMIVEAHDSIPNSDYNTTSVVDMFTELHKDVVEKDKRITELENEIKTIKNLLDNMNISI